MLLNGKGFSRKRLWPNLRYYVVIRMEGLSKTTKISIIIAGRWDQDLKPGPLEY
jgi:hypothetical protein